MANSLETDNHTMRFCHYISLFVFSFIVTSCAAHLDMPTNRALSIYKSIQKSEKQIISNKEKHYLTLKEAIVLANQKSDFFIKERLRNQVAYANAKGFARIDNPQFRMRNIDADDNFSGKANFEVALRVPVPNPLYLAALSEQSSFIEKQKKLSNADIRRGVRSYVRKLYAKFAALKLKYEHLSSLKKEFETYYKLAKKSEEKQLATTETIVLPQLRYAEILDLSRRVEIEKLTAKRELRQLFLNEDIEYKASDEDLRIDSRAEKMQTLIEKALITRKDLKLNYLRLKTAKARLKAEKTKRWPWLRFAEVSYQVRPDDNSNDFAFYVAVDIPLFDFNGGAIEKWKTRVESETYLEKSKVHAAVEEVKEAYRRNLMMKKRYRDAQKILGPILEQRKILRRKSNEAELYNPIKALIIGRQYMRAYQRYISIQLDYKMSSIDLDTAIGDN